MPCGGFFHQIKENLFSHNCLFVHSIIDLRMDSTMVFTNSHYKASCVVICCVFLCIIFFSDIYYFTKYIDIYSNSLNLFKKLLPFQGNERRTTHPLD